VTRSVSILLLLALSLAAPAGAFARAGAPDTTDALAIDWSKVPEYRLVPGDHLSIDLGPKPDPSQEYLHEVVIRPDGRITVHPIGDVVAAGLTPMELQRSIVTLLSAELRAPRATVEVVSMAANQVHVLGRVEHPGMFPALPFMTVTQAVAAAGGFSNDASRNSVLLIHRQGPRTVSVSRLPLEKVLKGQSLVDPPVSRFDIVYVPRSSVGNMNIFLKSFFEGLSLASTTSLMGWELFNLDRIYIARP
jgi:protein involved in polysaccharide export with SLBB domain